MGIHFLLIWIFFNLRKNREMSSNDSRFLTYASCRPHQALRGVVTEVCLDSRQPEDLEILQWPCGEKLKHSQLLQNAIHRTAVFNQLIDWSDRDEQAATKAYKDKNVICKWADTPTQAQNPAEITITPDLVWNSLHPQQWRNYPSGLRSLYGRAS